MILQALRVCPHRLKAPSRPRSATSLARLASGWAAGGIGLVVVLLGGWWFTLAVGVIVHLGLLEFFRMAQFKGIRPATKTTLEIGRAHV